MEMTSNNVLNKIRIFMENLKSLRFIDWAMILFFSQRLFSFIFSSLLGTKGVIVVMGLLVLLYFFSVIEAVKKEEYKPIATILIVFLGIVLLALLTMIINPGAKAWLMSFDYGFLIRIFDPRRAIFAFFIIVLVKDPKSLLRNLQYSSWMMFLFLFVQIILFLITNSWTNYYVLTDSYHVDLSYNMSLGYELIFVSLVFFTLAFYKSKKLYRTFGFIGLFFTLLFGSRGALIPLLAYGFILGSMYLWSKKEWLHKNKNSLLKVGLVFLIVSALLIFGYFYWLRPQLLDGTFTTHSRNLDMLLKGEFFADNGRFRMWGHALEVIQYHFPFGGGMYGDRFHVGRYFHWGYSHNIFLEVLASFGLIGLILLLGFIVVVTKTIFKRQHSEYTYLILLFFTMNSKLLVSDSFWFYDYFWALAALILVLKWAATTEKEASQSKLTKTGSINKGVTLSILILFLANVASGTYFLYQEVNNQHYKGVDIPERSVLLLVDGENDAFVQSISNIFRGRNIPLNVFIDAEGLEADTMDYLQEYEQVDVGLKLNTQPLTEVNSAQITSELEQIASQLDGFELQAVSTEDTFLDSKTIETIGNEFGPLFIKEGNSNLYYTELTASDLYHLNGIAANMHARDQVNKQIIHSVSNDALAIMFLEDVSTNEEEFKEQNRYIQIVAEGLANREFNFISISDLREQVDVNEEERTLWNYIKNTDLVRKLMGTISGGNNE